MTEMFTKITSHRTNESEVFSLAEAQRSYLVLQKSTTYFHYYTARNVLLVDMITWVAEYLRKVHWTLDQKCLQVERKVGVYFMRVVKILLIKTPCRCIHSMKTCTCLLLNLFVV